MVATQLGPTERALVDLARVALTNDLDGIRQICRRFIRRPPTDQSFAVALRGELSSVLSTTPGSSNPLRSASLSPTIEVDQDEFSWTQYPNSENEPVYSSELFDVVHSLISEHSLPERLENFGLNPSRTVLLTGPPGVGKTLTASYVASRLGLPLVTVNLASLMSSFMGRTGQNLQMLIDQSSQNQCVLFFDEFDAIAKSRDDNSDVGEVKRLANVVLQQLDMWPNGNLLLAATNHPELLDSAVHRRFDLTIDFGLPGYKERFSYVKCNDIIQRLDIANDEIAILATVTEGWSPADIQNWINRTARRALVKMADVEVDQQSADIVEALVSEAKWLARSWSAQSVERRSQLAQLATTNLGWTQRRVADWLGVSHVTIGKDLNRKLNLSI